MDQVTVLFEESTVTSRIRSVKRSRGLGYVAVSVQLVGTAELLSSVCVPEYDLLSMALILVCTVASYHDSPGLCMLRIG